MLWSLKVRIWLATIGEPVPVREGTRDRLHRTGYFAHFLADRGHEVTWWTSTFDHFRKKHWFDSDSTLHVNNHLGIELIHGCGYGSNVSIARLRDHRQIASKFAKLARLERNPPDIIVAALPTIGLCLESAKFGRERDVPMVLDVRDLWPDIFLDLLPWVLRPIGRLVLWRMFRDSHAACSCATAITGVTEPFVDWGLGRGGRTRSPMDRRFGFGYVKSAPSAEEIKQAEEFWKKWGLAARNQEFVVSFIGTIGRQFELKPVIDAARIIQKAGRPFRLVLCGAGDRLEHYRSMAGDLDNIVFPGWVGRAEIYTLLRFSSIGLAPYRDTPNFRLNIANKPAEYLSAGLPIGLSLRDGVLCDLLHAENCGFSYGASPEKLAGRICHLADNPHQRRVLADNALKLFEEKFTAEKVYGEMMAYLEQVVATTKPGSHAAEPTS